MQIAEIFLHGINHALLEYSCLGTRKVRSWCSGYQFPIQKYIDSPVFHILRLHLVVKGFLCNGIGSSVWEPRDLTAKHLFNSFHMFDNILPIYIHIVCNWIVWLSIFLDCWQSRKMFEQDSSVTNHKILNLQYFISRSSHTFPPYLYANFFILQVRAAAAQ